MRVFVCVCVCVCECVCVREPLCLPCVFVLLQSVGSDGSGRGQFNMPWGLAVTPDQAQLVVADRNNHRLVVLNAADGQPVSEFDPNDRTTRMRAGHNPPSDRIMPCPVSVIIVPHTGQVLVADIERHQMLLFTSLDAPTIVRTFGEGRGNKDCQLDCPFGVALIEATDIDVDVHPATAAVAAAGADPTLVVIADTHNHRVVVYHLCDGSLVRHFGSRGSSPGQFQFPRSIALVPSSATPGDHSGWLAVADDMNRHVQVVTQIGQPIRVLTGPEANPLYLLSNSLCGIVVCIGADGLAEILVADSDNHRVVAFALDGCAARVVCGAWQAGSGAGELNFPAGLVVTAGGDLWVSELGNSRMSLFR
jgi:DNA-binding beta-propeller fold protein YncE